MSQIPNLQQAAFIQLKLELAEKAGYQHDIDHYKAILATLLGLEAVKS